MTVVQLEKIPTGWKCPECQGEGRDPAAMRHGAGCPVAADLRPAEEVLDAEPEGGGGA